MNYNEKSILSFYFFGVIFVSVLLLLIVYFNSNFNKTTNLVLEYEKEIDKKLLEEKRFF